MLGVCGAEGLVIDDAGVDSEAQWIAHRHGRTRSCLQGWGALRVAVSDHNTESVGWILHFLGSSSIIDVLSVIPVQV